MNRRESLPAPKPQEILNRGRIVYIKHPAQDRLLFSFPALSTDSTGNHYGVFHPLVLDACRILTNRAASSQGDIDSDFLATDIEGHNRVSINITYLDVDFYYFLGPPEDEINRNYPIVKTLSAFTFPTVLPDRWAKIADAWRQQRSDPERPPATASQMSAIVERRDRKCALTRWRDCTQCAHLIPAAEEDWFVTDDMAELISEELFPGIHHPANGVLLRADVRMCFDAHSFVFYPDTDNDRADDRRFVAYIVQGGYADMPELLHRRPATIHPDVLVEFVYARFAYAIINLPRRNAFFASVEESDMLKIVRENRLEFEEERMSRDRDDGSDESDTDTDNHSDSSSPSPNDQSIPSHAPQDEEDAASEGDKRWRSLLFSRLPHLSNLPEVDDPPATFTGGHAETPHMLRLRSEYIKRNPQVGRTAGTPAGATREGVEGFYARWITRHD